MPAHVIGGGSRTLEGTLPRYPRVPYGLRGTTTVLYMYSLCIVLLTYMHGMAGRPAGRSCMPAHGSIVQSGGLLSPGGWYSTVRGTLNTYGRLAKALEYCAQRKS